MKIKMISMLAIAWSIFTVHAETTLNEIKNREEGNLYKKVSFGDSFSAVTKYLAKHEKERMSHYSENRFRSMLKEALSKVDESAAEKVLKSVFGLTVAVESTGRKTTFVANANKEIIAVSSVFTGVTATKIVDKLNKKYGAGTKEELVHEFPVKIIHTVPTGHYVTLPYIKYQWKDKDILISLQYNQFDRLEIGGKSDYDSVLNSPEFKVVQRQSTLSKDKCATELKKVLESFETESLPKVQQIIKKVSDGRSSPDLSLGMTAIGVTLPDLKQGMSELLLYNPSYFESEIVKHLGEYRKKQKEAQIKAQKEKEAQEDDALDF